QLARNLRSGRTMTIGVVVPDIANPFFARFLQEIEAPLRDREHALIIGDSREQIEIEAQLLRNMKERQVDGLIVAPVGESHPALEDAAADDLPMVMFDRLAETANPVFQISADHRNDARKATEYLISEGHRTILCLRGNPESKADRDRVAGYFEALTQHQLPEDAGLLIGSSYEKTASRLAVSEFFAGSGKATACVSLGGQNTLGLLEACREQSLVIPSDLSVVAFDDQPWATLIDPPLTTLAQPISEMARAAASAILEQLGESKPEPGLQVFQSELIARQSVITLSPN
ncbi:MAG: LacI family DNA-binding transcriptional regulator, partial [Verrucomicrobiota bacterium]